MALFSLGSKSNPQDRLTPLGIKMETLGGQVNVLSFSLPTKTMQGHELVCLPDQKMKFGAVAVEMFKVRGLDKIVFKSDESNGVYTDRIALGFSSYKAMLDAEAHAVKTMADFVIRAKSSIAVSLIPTYLLVTTEDLKKAAAKFSVQHADEPYLAGIKGVIEVFNDLVARPHEGEVIYQKYGLNQQQQQTVVVSLFQKCATCAVSSLSVSGSLKAMLRHFMPGDVDELKIVTVPQ